MDLSTNILGFLATSLDAVRFDLVNHHAIWGIAFKYSEKVGLKDIAFAKSIYLKQWLQNKTYLELMSSLREELINIDEELVTLKGINHLCDLYKDDIALRFMSDIDLLVTPSKFEKVINFLSSQGFSSNKDSKWYGDQHKLEMYKQVNGVQVTIELHTKLFYHQESFKYKIEKNNIGFNQLALEERLVYLCTHYCFQHTMLKLYWFIDIALLIEKYPEIKWDTCLKIAKEWRVEKSFKYVIGAVNQHWKPICPNYKGRYQKLIDLPFLFNTNQRAVKYLFLKNIVKDSWLTNLKYNLLWLKSSKP